MNLELARYNMVEQQIKPLGVTSEQILHLMLTLKREEFVPAEYTQIAYADTAIALGNGRYLLAPNLIGRMLQAIGFHGNEDVLEVGAGTGYITALLAQLAQHVTSFEPHKALATQANQHLRELELNNYEIINANAIDKLKGSKGFDVIILTGSVPYLPKIFSQHLRYGGRLFAIIGTAPVMHACIFTRINEREWSKTILFETVVPAYKGIVDATTFEF